MRDVDYGGRQVCKHGNPGHTRWEEGMQGVGEWGSCHVTSDLSLCEGSTGCVDDGGREHLRRCNNRLNNSLNVETAQQMAGSGRRFWSV